MELLVNKYLLIYFRYLNFVRLFLIQFSVFSLIFQALKHAGMIFMLSSPVCINWQLIAYYMVFYITGVWVDEIYQSLKIKSEEKKGLEAKAEMKEKDGTENGCYTCWYEKE